jgi:hypothetical protein
MSTYPVALTIHSPARYQRVQIPLRILLGIALGFFGITFGWLACALYLVLPVIAAIAVASRGESGFQIRVAPGLRRVIAWLVALDAYLALTADRFPLGDEGRDVHLVVSGLGHPTVGSALLRLITSIPTALVLVVLSAIGMVVWIFGAIAILVSETQPAGLVGFARGLVRWRGRWLAYHASLVDAPPPFALDPDEGSPPPEVVTRRAPG